MLDREGAIEVNGDHTDFLTLRIQIFGRFFGGFSARAHHDDHALGIRGAGIIEQVIRTAGQFGELIHCSLDDLGVRA